MAVKNIRQIIKFPKGCKETLLPLRAGGRSNALLRAGVTLAGVSDLVDGYEIVRSPRAETHMAVFTDAGRGVYIADGKRHVLEKGSVFVCPCSSSERYYPEGGFWRKFWFHLEDVPSWAHLKRSGPELKKALEPDLLLEAMRRFMQESRSVLPGSASMAELYAEIIAIHLKRELGSASTSRKLWMAKRFDELEALVNSDLRRRWTLASLSKAASLSTAHFSRLCNEIRGVSPMKMVARLRLRRAAEFLASTDMKLGEIASLVGYGGAFSLSTALKRELGRCPRRLRSDAFSFARRQSAR